MAKDLCELSGDSTSFDVPRPTKGIGLPWFCRLPRVKTLLSVLAVVVLCGATYLAVRMHAKYQLLTELGLQEAAVGFHQFGPEWLSEMDESGLTELISPIEDLSISTSKAQVILSRRNLLNRLESLKLRGGDDDAEDSADVEASLALASRLRQLGKVELGNCRVTKQGLASLESLPRLRELIFQDAKLTPGDFSAIGNLPQLTRVSFYGEFTDEYFVSLTHLPELEELVLSGSSTPLSLRSLGHLKKLKILDLSGVGLNGMGVVAINELPSLEWLDVSSSPLGDADLDRLDACQSLIGLNIEQTSVSGPGLTRFLKSHPKLKHLATNGPAITPARIKQLVVDYGITEFARRCGCVMREFPPSSSY